MDEKVIPVAGIVGDDDNARIVPKRIIADPVTGQGDVRGGLGFPRDKTEEWDMRPSPPDYGDGYDRIETIGKSPNDIMEDIPFREEELGQGADGGGKRFNKGKNKMELTPPEWEWALADVTTQGSKKYEERNWEQGMPWSTMIGCMKRHVNKFLAGERYDGKEFDLEKGTTGCHHLAMVAWNALALMSYDLRQIGTNDLPKEVQLELFDRVNNSTSDLGNEVHGGTDDDNS